MRVDAENPKSNNPPRHVLSVFATYVALDEKGKPTKVPGLILETSEQKRRFSETIERRNERKAKKRNDCLITTLTHIESM